MGDTASVPQIVWPQSAGGVASQTHALLAQQQWEQEMRNEQLLRDMQFERELKDRMLAEVEAKRSGQIDDVLKGVNEWKKFMASRNLARDLSSGVPLATALMKNPGLWGGEPSSYKTMMDISAPRFTPKTPIPIKDVTGKIIAYQVELSDGRYGTVDVQESKSNVAQQLDALALQGRSYSDLLKQFGEYPPQEGTPSYSGYTNLLSKYQNIPVQAGGILKQLQTPTSGTAAPPPPPPNAGPGVPSPSAATGRYPDGQKLRDKTTGKMYVVTNGVPVPL